MTKIGCCESFWTTLVGKDREKCKMTIIGHSKSFWTMLVGKDWDKCGMTKNGHSESFWTTLVGKDWKKYRTKIEHCLYICYKNVKIRMCQKLSFYILLAVFMLWVIGYRLVIKMSKLECAKRYLCIHYLQCLCFGVLAVWMSWLQYVCPGENIS